MYELRDLRLKAGPSYTVESVAKHLAMTVKEFMDLENTPLEKLNLGDVAFYLDALALDIEVNATWLTRSIMRERLAPEGSHTIFGPWSIGRDAEVLKRGRRILRDALDENEPPSEPDAGEEVPG
jgi:hypothetical protein